jgi:hypothetical protein
MWLIGTLAGGIVGFGLTWQHHMSTNRPFLAALLTIGAALAGLGNVTRYRVGIILGLMTLEAIVLCQCCQTERWEYTTARVVSVVSGVLTAAVVNNVLLPWYTSDWAVSRMADCYRDANALLAALYARCWSDGADAVAAFVVGAGGRAGDEHDNESSGVSGIGKVQWVTAGGGQDNPQPLRFTQEEITAVRGAADELGTAAAATLPPWQLPALAGGADVAGPSALQMLLARPLAEVQVRACAHIKKTMR